MSEATARIKINKLLEEAGWRFFAEGDRPANIRLEPGVTISRTDLDEMGENFERAARGYVDFLLLDERNFPLVVLEAKKEDLSPLVGKEQARAYALSQKCRFVILSNGDVHYFWDLEHGNPELITSFPTPKSVMGKGATQPNPERLVAEPVEADYVVLTQRPTYASEAAWKNADERDGFVAANKLRFLRPYQLKAVQAIQTAVQDGRDRFLFEMATGTGKTLTSASIIKLFLRTGNAHRVLFLVDRLELENQAKTDISAVLRNDYRTVVYKENRADWQNAEIVVTTVQSLLFDNKYQKLFSPTDFDLVISDEAHRSIGGNARAVFDYFVGNKLGLTATPRDYLKKFNPDDDTTQDPRESERRLLLDTYRTFGCESGQPTFRYSMLEGVKDGYLISPTVVDVRSEITTALLSTEGFVVNVADDTGENEQESFKQREFEKRFFSESTNQLFCKTFLENALVDPISKEIGKSIIFAVSQLHATKLTQILNQMADIMFPGKYNSDFAVQVTSQIADAQQYTLNFKYNTLLGSENFLQSYKTSKARVCVTVGMMTTGYDCSDILNLGLFRPIFSPTDFIQIKGRGTRKHDFTELLFDAGLKKSVGTVTKTTFKLFDFFANCEYFEEDFSYGEVLELPKPGGKKYDTPDEPPSSTDRYKHLGSDILMSLNERKIGYEGMRIDRELFGTFESEIRADQTIVDALRSEQWDLIIDYVNKKFLDGENPRYTLERLRLAADVDRRLTVREIIEKSFGLITDFKMRDELLEEEFAKFLVDYKPDDTDAIPALKTYFKAYVTSDVVRDIIQKKEFADLATNPVFKTSDYKAVPEKYRTIIPQYVRDYVPISNFAP
ncbi:MAG: DEAD/DEAH box helicase family protein [Ignavibacteria bacterium]|nr:DEAD/DEAH box helicase family protein [Ignavibacteria bacterium]